MCRSRFLKNFKRIKILSVLFCLSCFYFCFTGGTGHAAATDTNTNANPFNETIRILERWTSSHWGRDCFVWVVHYSDELIGPWVEAEALKTGMTEGERLAYRDRFVSELKLDTSETFLVSIYSFGPRPVNVSPVKDNIALITASGGRLKPTRYDSSLDSPAAGIVQGLVFFPKQRDINFALAIKGMGVLEERIFSFEGPRFSAVSAAAPQAPEPEVVVIDLPKREPAPKKTAKTSKPRTVEPPSPPQPPAPPRFIPPLFAESSKDMADFVKTARGRGTASKDEDAAPEKGTRSSPRAPSQPHTNSGSAYASREYVLKQFLNLWADNKAGEMYDMLSEGSRKVISRENFAKDVARASDFRAGLRGDYRIEWVGEERAKIVTDRRLLMFRSLVTRTLGVTRESSAWKIVW